LFYPEFWRPHPSRKSYKKQILRLAALAQNDSVEGGHPVYVASGGAIFISVRASWQRVQTFSQAP